MKRLLIPLLVLGALFLGGCSSLLFYPSRWCRSLRRAPGWSTATSP